MNDIAITIATCAFSSIPVVGSFLSEILINYPERRYQRRLNRFTEIWIEFLNTLTNGNIDFEYLKTEEFGDIFLLFIDKIQKTRNEEKLRRLAKILTNEISKDFHYSSDFKETFLDVVMKINEDQIRILNEYRRFRDEGFEEEETFPQPGVIDGGTLGGEKKEIISPHRLPDHYGLEKAKYQFYIQDLISKSLLFDNGMGRVGTTAFELLEITDYGYEFIRYTESVGEGTNNIV